MCDLQHYSICCHCFQSGPNNASIEDLGVNYRALNDLFSISTNRKSSIVYEIGVQVIEIYNEQVRDLLTVDASKKYPFFNYYIWKHHSLRGLLFSFSYFRKNKT